MPTPVNNAPGGTGQGGAPAGNNGGAGLKVKANINPGQNNEAIHQLNTRIGNDSQTAPPQNANQNAIHNAQDGHHNPPAAPATRGNNGDNGNHYGQLKNGNNGNHYGQLKNGNNGNNGNQGQAAQVNVPPQGNNPPPGQTPPIIAVPQGNPNPTGQTPNPPPVQTPPIFINPKQSPDDLPTPTLPGQTPPIIEHPTANGPQKFPTTNPQFPQYPGNNYPPLSKKSNWYLPILIFNTRIYNPSVPYGVVRNAVADILRQNDIYLSRNVINQLVGNRNSAAPAGRAAPSLPAEVSRLVETIALRLARTLNNSSPPAPQYLRQLAMEFSSQLRPELNAVRNALIYTVQPEAKHFSQLNLQERVFLAVDLMFRHLPADTSLQHLSNREVYQGLLLARGLVGSNENAAEIRNLISFRGDFLPVNFSVAGLRDLGRLVRVLAADASGAKTTANLDLAVQKFIRILIANNELGLLLAAAALAKQAEQGTLSIGRTLLLVQIYQLISRLIMAGEAALKEAAAKNAQIKNDAGLAAGFGKVTDPDERAALMRELQASSLQHGLKNFLEFNPACVTERAASAFFNPDDARQAEHHFINHYADEIEQWLAGGNHRFVKEFDLDKPVGVVVERGSDAAFPASKARVVLVRDGSVQGWHVLKSFLVV
jgi:hypothetical protein